MFDAGLSKFASSKLAIEINTCIWESDVPVFLSTYYYSRLFHRKGRSESFTRSGAGWEKLRVGEGGAQNGRSCGGEGIPRVDPFPPDWTRGRGICRFLFTCQATSRPPGQVACGLTVVVSRTGVLPVLDGMREMRRGTC